MEISREIITDGILKMEKHYEEIKDLFAGNDIPGCRQIKETLESFEQLQPGKISPNKKRYPNLKSRYDWLENYSDKTIYMFSVTDFPHEITWIKDEFKKLSSKSLNKEKISLCRVNENSRGWKELQENEPVCLYVGSSKDITQRLKEHLFLYNSTAYAMHLAGWFPEDLLITIDVWDFSKFLEGKNHEFLQSIEDLLWAHYEPLFGRQGKK